MFYGRAKGERNVVAERIAPTGAAMLEGLVMDLVREKGYYWDKKKAQYVSRWTGKPVKEATVRHAVEKFNSSFVAENIEAHTQRFLDGAIDLPAWQKRVANELKQGHIINSTVGKGGRAQMTFADWGRTGRALRDQYSWLNNFAVEIKNGQLTAGQIKHRAGMYANSVRSSYFRGLTAAKKIAGNTQERRITTSEKPCDTCISVEARGWQPIGTLPMPGTDCEGYSSCKCIMEYRKNGT